jgi:hypothetical protein
MHEDRNVILFFKEQLDVDLVTGLFSSVSVIAYCPSSIKCSNYGDYISLTSFAKLP